DNSSTSAANAQQEDASTTDKLSTSGSGATADDNAQQEVEDATTDNTQDATSSKPVNWWLPEDMDALVCLLGASLYCCEYMNTILPIYEAYERKDKFNGLFLGISAVVCILGWAISVTAYMKDPSGVATYCTGMLPEGGMKLFIGICMAACSFLSIPILFFVIPHFYEKRVFHDLFKMDCAAPTPPDEIEGHQATAEGAENDAAGKDSGAVGRSGLETSVNAENSAVVENSAEIPFSGKTLINVSSGRGGSLDANLLLEDYEQESRRLENLIAASRPVPGPPRSLVGSKIMNEKKNLMNTQYGAEQDFRTLSWQEQTTPLLHNANTNY
ncbi:unnamed protein product, partial [Amoebophrya sp. A25]